VIVACITIVDVAFILFVLQFCFEDCYNSLALRLRMAYRTIQQEYMQIPPVTRAYTTACVLTTVAVVS